MVQCSFYDQTTCHRIGLNGMGFIYMIYIFELLIFSVINIFVFKFNLCEDISNDVSVYLSNCGSIVETA